MSQTDNFTVRYEIEFSKQSNQFELYVYTNEFPCSVGGYNSYQEAYEQGQIWVDRITAQMQQI